MNAAIKAPAYVKCLDGVRALSIILVLLGHTVPSPGPKFLQLNVTAAKMGMALFFCLSGYLIVSMLCRSQKVTPFLIKRVLRNVPAAWVYLLVIFMLIDMPLENLTLNVFFLNNYFSEALTVEPVGHFWSLSVEMHFYLAIALVVLVLGHKGVWLVPVAAVVFTWLLIVLALLLLFAASHPLAGPINYYRAYCAAFLVGLVMHCNIRLILRTLEGGIPRYIARISYALYIYHPLMMFGFMNTGSTIERYAFKRPLSWVLTRAAAHISTHYLEAYWQKRA